VEDNSSSEERRKSKVNSMDELVKLGGVLGLEGNDLKKFIEQKMAEEREERTKRERTRRGKRELKIESYENWSSHTSWRLGSWKPKS